MLVRVQLLSRDPTRGAAAIFLPSKWPRELCATGFLACISVWFTLQRDALTCERQANREREREREREGRRKRAHGSVRWWWCNSVTTRRWGRAMETRHCLVGKPSYDFLSLSSHQRWFGEHAGHSNQPTNEKKLSKVKFSHGESYPILQNNISSSSSYNRYFLLLLLQDVSHAKKSPQPFPFSSLFLPSSSPSLMLKKIPILWSTFFSSYWRKRNLPKVKGFTTRESAGAWMMRCYWLFFVVRIARPRIVSY